VNVLFGGLPTKRSQKATQREVLNIEPAVPTPLRWSEVPITFSRADQWTNFSEPECFPLVLKPVVAGSRLNKVLIDGGSGLNVLFTKTLKKMKLDITNMLLTDKRRIPLRSASVRTHTFFTTGFPRFLSIHGARGLQAFDLPLHTSYSNPNYDQSRKQLNHTRETLTHGSMILDHAIA
jgi:hypothetical protein